MKTFTKTWLALASLCLAASVGAKTPSDQAAKLGNELTPLGAEQAGNSSGTIPAWTGGITTPPAGYQVGDHHPDPFADEQPLFVITASNYQEYKDQLSAGQIALFETYADWTMPVYPSHRTASFPEYVYQGAIDNAERAEVVEGGNGVTGASVGVPFPIPNNGLEAVFNHNLRWRAEAATRQTAQAAPTRSGDYTLVKFDEQFEFFYAKEGTTPEMVTENNLVFYFKQRVTAPSRLVGSILLVHETVDQVREPRRAWTYNTGQRRVRRAPNIAYDNPGTASDGIRTSDNFDMYNGAPDRYDWKLLGKKELYIPYNSYQLHSDELKYSDIIKPGHINSDLARYELHRVWVVEGTVKSNTSHIYAKRTFYIDEDSWQIAIADHYDARGQLWRVAEAHSINYYDVPMFWTTLEVLYDLQAGRYIALGLDNEEDMYDFKAKLDQRDFTPAALRREGRR